MKRLFFSLYAVVVLALAFIGWSSEQLWQMMQSSSDNEIAQMAQLSILLREVDDLPTKRAQLSQQLDVNITIKAMSDIAWMSEQVTQLQAGQPVLLYDQNDDLLIYIATKSKEALGFDSAIVELGPIAFLPPENGKKRLLLSLSYLLLAGAIGLWSWPLWRDLKVLQTATENVGKGRFDEVPKVSKSSVISPVVDTFNTMSDRIGALVEEQKELTNAVSHELRTPLSRLKFSLALQQSDDNGMAEDVKELEALVDEMLSYSRLESGSRSLVLAQVNIHQLLENLLDKLGSNSDIELQLICDTQLSWQCDGHFLERALQNLITNGIRYAKSKVLVNVDIVDGQLAITVEDDGLGVDESEHAQIFKPFVRLDKSRTKDEGGFGLGLAIVKRIVQWHKGRCFLSRSKLGGACFIITIC